MQFYSKFKNSSKTFPHFYFQMFDWIFSNKESFLVNYVDIGHSYTTAKKLQDEHSVRTHNSNVSYHQFFFTFIFVLIVLRIYVTYHFSDGLRECHSYFTRSLPNPRKWSLRRKSRAFRSYSFRTNLERLGIYCLHSKHIPLCGGIDICAFDKVLFTTEQS